ALLEPRDERERLERRPGLEALRPAVGEVRVVVDRRLPLLRRGGGVVDAVMGHREDLAGARLDDRHGRRDARLVLAPDGGTDLLVREVLQLAVEGRGDLETAAVEPGGALVLRLAEYG